MNAISRPQINLGMKMSMPTLFAGDIIATMSEGKSSEAIRWATNAPFSHAILCLPFGRAIDAMPGKGVTKARLEAKLKGAAKAAVFRHRTATKSQCDLATAWAGAQVGKRYDNLGAARVGLGTGSRTEGLKYLPPGRLLTVADELSGALANNGHDNSFFCSELIFRAFAVAGVPLIDLPVYSSGPGHLLQTSQLVYMGNLQDLV